MYIVELFSDFLPVDYEHQGDQWLDLLSEEIKQRIAGVNGYSVTPKQASADFRYPHLELKLMGTQVIRPNENVAVDIDTPSLKIVPVKPDADSESTALYVVLSSEREITAADKEAWKSALEAAVERLGEANPAFEWGAALGQANDLNQAQYAIRQARALGGVVVRSGRQQHVQYLEGVPPSFMSGSFSVSWPIVVEGTSSGYNWLVASRQAGLDTHRVAMLVSLAWGSTWYLLSAPQPAERGALKIPPANNLMPGLSPRLPHAKRYKRLPKWLTLAWKILDEDESLRRATNAYYEGLLMEKKHASYALIALVSSIETVGRKIIGDKCSCCGNRTTFGQRFRAGIDEVVKDKQKAKELYKLYDSRSGTAHDGMLHADENVMGSIHFPSLFGTAGSDVFILKDLRTIKGVARRLMTKALKGKIKYAR